MDATARRKLVSDYVCKITGSRDLDDSVDVFETGLVNSLAAIQLIAFLEKNFRVKVNIDDLDKANFCSVEALCAFLSRKVTSGA
jgi:acyl carrier protein